MTLDLPPAPEPENLPELKVDDWLGLPPGQVWARMYFHAGRYPTSWSSFRQEQLPAPGRFDVFDVAGVNGVLYLAVPTGGGNRTGNASAIATCMTEVAGHAKTLDRLDQRSLVIAELTMPLNLLDVSSDWAARAGVGTHLSTAPHRETCAWAAAVAARWPELHGIAYRSASRPAGRAIAAWSPRAVEAITTSTRLVQRTLNDPAIQPILTTAAHLTGTTLLN